MQLFCTNLKRRKRIRNKRYKRKKRKKKEVAYFELIYACNGYEIVLKFWSNKKHAQCANCFYFCFKYLFTKSGSTFQSVLADFHVALLSGNILNILQDISIEHFCLLNKNSFRSQSLTRLFMEYKI